VNAAARATALGLAAALAVAGCSARRQSAKDIHIGRPAHPTTVPLPAATIAPAPPSTSLDVTVPATVDLGQPKPPATGKPYTGLIDADGHAPGGALVFQSNVPVPPDLVFVLAVGSDSRPREDPRRGHADSIHLIAVNPRSGRGTILGFPRDSWVQIPGHGNRKLTEALALGGPQLRAETIRHLTGLPVDYYVISGFAGLPAMVDELGGINVFVERKMNDGYSGARFKPGWHLMNGEMILAFSRDRHDVPNGDFSRSENQGKVLLAALAKLRAEVGDEGGLRRWLEILAHHAVFDAAPDKLSGLAVLARRLDPAGIANVVVPGRVGTAGSASVVYLSDGAAKLFLDLRDDATLGSAPPPPPASTTAPPPSTTPRPPSTTSTAPVPTAPTSAP
jgi:LCP family protein required for cell wall assembly